MHPLNLLLAKIVPGVGGVAPITLVAAAGTLVSAGAMACPKACPTAPTPPVAPAAPTTPFFGGEPIAPTPPVAPVMLDRVAWHPGPEPHDAPVFFREPGSQERTTQVIEMNDNGRKLLVKIVDGKMSGKLNGKTLKPHQLSLNENGHVVVTGLDGELIELIKLNNVQGVSVAGDVNIVYDDDPEWAVATAQASGPRPVRIGITFSELSGALADQLGIDPAKAVVITGVDKKFPAALAGLRENDVIVRLGESKDGSESSIRKALLGKSPGDQIQIKVLRKGEPQVYTLKLASPDGKVVAGARGGRAIVREGQAFPRGFNIETHREIEDALAEAQEALEEAMGEGEYRRELDSVRRALELAHRQAREGDAIAKLRTRDGMTFFNDRNGNLPLVWRDNDNNEWVEEFEDRFDGLEDNLEDQLDHLSDRLDELNDRLDDLTDAIEKLAESFDR